MSSRSAAWMRWSGKGSCFLRVWASGRGGRDRYFTDDARGRKAADRALTSFKRRGFPYAGVTRHCFVGTEAPRDTDLVTWSKFG